MVVKAYEGKMIKVASIKNEEEFYDFVEANNLTVSQYTTVKDYLNLHVDVDIVLYDSAISLCIKGTTDPKYIFYQNVFYRLEDYSCKEIVNTWHTSNDVTTFSITIDTPRDWFEQEIEMNLDRENSK